MRKAKGAPEPTPLELIEIAKGVPLNQNELTLAWQSKQGSAVSWMDSSGRRWVKKNDLFYSKSPTSGQIHLYRPSGKARILSKNLLAKKRSNLICRFS